MSTTVDNRVVQMRFDNEEFEKKASKSLSTLDRLKNALKFSGASKNLDKVNESFKEVDANPLLKAIEGINGGFTTMVAKATLVNRATNALIDTTKRFISSMTLDQVNAGWDKYAEKTSAVQTIMAATSKDFKDTGAQMSYVNSQLEKLNWFTDETSYNFTEMVGNIGKFTSNGIKLDRSVTAMQGIATWAARSGANANEASRAMYNLSQALSTGAVKLIDWKSIENANMATAEFKENAIEAAVALGKLKKKGDGTYVTMKNNAVSVQNFNNALSDAWFTSDVLLNVLDRYGGFTNKLYEVASATDLTATQLLSAVDKYAEGTLDLQAYASMTGVDVDKLRGYLDELSSSTYELGRKSFQSAQEAKTFAEAISATSDAVSTGWMKTFELIFGDYEEAKKLWTNLANILYEVFAASGDVRNELFEGWREGGGRKTMLEGINEMMEAILRVIKPFKDAFRDIFPAKTSEDLLNFTNGFKNLMKALQLNSRQMTNIRRAMRGIFSTVDLGITAFKACASAIWNSLAPALGVVNNSFLDIIGDIGDFLYIITRMIKENDSLSISFKKVGKFATDILEIFKKLFAQIRESTTVQTGWKVVQNVLSSAVNSAAKLLKYISQVVSKIAGLDKITLSGLGNIFAGVGEDAIAYFKNLKFDIKDSDGVLDKFKNSIAESCGSVGASFDRMSNRVASALGNLKELLTKVPWGAMVSIAFGVALIHSLNKFIAALNTLGTPIGNLTKNLNGLLGSIKNMFNAITASIKAPSYLKIAKAIAILAGSIAILALLPERKLAIATASLSGVIAVFGILIYTLSELPKISDGAKIAVNAVTKTVVALSLSLLMLAGAFKLMEDIDPNDLLDTILAISAFIAVLTFAARQMNGNITRLSDASGKIKSTNTAAKNLLAMSAAIYVIAKAIESISDIQFKDPNSTILAVILAVGSVTTLTLALGKIKASDGVKGSASLILAVGSIIAMLKVIEKLDKVKFTTILSAVPKLALVMGELAALFYITRLLGNNAAKAGALMAGVGLGLMLIIGSIGILGSMKPSTIKKGVNAVTGLTVCIMGILAFSGLVGENAHKASVTLLAAAAAIGVLSIIAGIVGTLDAGQMARGVAYVAGLSLVLGALIAATHLAKNLGKDIITLTVAMVAISSMVAALAGFTDADKLQNASLCLMGIMGVMAIVMAVSTLVRPSLAGMAIIVTAIGALGLIIGVMAEKIQNVDSLIPIAESLKILMNALLVAVVASIGAAAVGALAIPALTGLAAVVLAVGVILGIISAINVPDDLPEKCTNIGLAIGNLIGSLLGGIVSGAFSAIEQIGDSLKIFGDIMSQTDFNSIGLGINAGVGLVKLLKEIPGPNIWQVFGGKGNIEAFTGQFEAFGTALKTYGDTVANANNTAILMSIPGVKALVEIANSIPDYGVFDIFTGMKSMSVFGAQLLLFGIGLSAYSWEVALANIKAIQDSIPAVRALVEISNTLENSGGLITIFTGDNNFKKFGEQLKSFGEAFAEYGNSIANVDFQKIRESVVGARSLVDIANAIPDSGGLWGWLSGKQNLDDLGNNLSKFGKGMAGYYNAIEGVVFTDSTQMLNQVRKILEFAPEVENVDLSPMENFGKKIKAFGGNLLAFFTFTDLIPQPTPIENICKEIVESISALQTYSDLFRKAGEDCIAGLLQGLSGEDSLRKVRMAASNMGNAFIDAFRDTTGWHSPWSTMIEAGKDSALGLLLGVQKSKAYEAGEDLSQNMLDGFNDLIGRHSEPDEYIAAAEDAGDALSTGSENAESTANKAGKNLAGEFLSGTSEKLEKGAPTVFGKIKDFISSKKDEYLGVDKNGGLVGLFGLGFDTDETNAAASGLTNTLTDTITQATNNSSGAFSASGTKAAGTFLTAFESKLSDLDLDLSTIDLEQELWEATIGKTASEQDKKAKETEVITEKIKIQNEKVDQANQKYEYTIKKMGKTSEDAKKAYQQLLQEQIDLANLMNKLNESRNTVADNSTDAMVAYAQYIAESQDDLLKMGFTMEQISAAAAERTGYNLQNTTQTMTDTVTSAVSTAMNTVSNTYLATAESTLGALNPSFQAYGAEYATSIGNGMTTTTSAVTAGANALAMAGKTAIMNDSQNWHTLGQNCAEGFKQGILSKVDEIATAAAAIANAAFTAAQIAIESHSPSRKFMWLGEMADQGLIVGLKSMQGEVENASTGVSEGAIKAAQDTIKQIADFIDTDATLHPQITPIVDMTDVQAGFSRINRLHAPTLHTTVTGARVAAVASSLSQRQSNLNQPVPQNNQNGPQVIEFVQNNYSPKALSRSEIYRNTNNQFTAFKEAISKV